MFCIQMELILIPHVCVPQHHTIQHASFQLQAYYVMTFELIISMQHGCAGLLQ